MTIREARDQTGVPNGKVRYEFDTRIFRQRFRKNITCQKSAVSAFYRKWEQSIIDGSIDKNFSLFEKLSEYEKHVRALKPKNSFRHTERSLRLFRQCFKNIFLRDFKRFHVLEYIKWRRNSRVRNGGKTEISDRSINREIGELSIFMTWCIERDYYIGNNPCFKAKIKVDVRREIRLTVPQIEEILSKAYNRGKIYTAILIALLTGMRRNEIYTLQWDDVDFTGSRIHLKGSNTKTKRARVVAMPEYLFDHLSELRKTEPFQSEIFWNWQTAEALRSQWIRLRKTFSFYPEIDLHFHDLRHVYAQALRDAGVAIQDISAFLGHSEIGTTQRFYAQEGGHNAKEKVEMIGEIIPIFKKKEKIS